MEVRTMQQRAVERAIHAGLPARVVRIAWGHYEVPSTSRAGVVHTVRHTRGIGGEAALSCTCESGHRPACVHRASVYVRKLQEQGLTVKPKAAAPAPKPARQPRKEVALV